MENIIRICSPSPIRMATFYATSWTELTVGKLK